MIPRVPHPAPAVRALLALAVVVTLAGAGCARSVSPGDSVLTGPTGSTARTSPPVSPGPTRSAPTGPTLTVDGVARRGVEPGCTVLDAGDHTLYLLLGTGGHTPAQGSIPLGVPLRVRGVPVDQVVSYCQQGTPLEVVDVTRR